MEESRVRPLLLYLLRDQQALTARCYWGMLGDYGWGRGTCGYESALAGLNAAVRHPGPAMRFPPLRHRHRQDYTAFKWAAAAGNGARGTPVAAATWAMIWRAINLAGEISADLSSPTNEAVKLLLHLHVSLDESGWQEQDALRRHLGMNAARTHARTPLPGAWSSQSGAAIPAWAPIILKNRITSGKVWAHMWTAFVHI